MKLFIANASSQNHRIYLRFPERASMTTYDVAPGSQTVIENLNASDIAYFKHHADTYGYAEAKKAAGSDFSGVIYSVDNEVSESAIHDKNGDLKDAQIKKSESVLAAGAAAVDAALSQGRGEKEGKSARSETTVEIQSESVDQNDKSPNGVKKLVIGKK